MHVSDIDSDLISDLRDELEDKREICNELLLQLEDSPEDSEIVRKLFRDIHTIKGDIGLMGIQPYIPLLQAIEDILDRLRQKTLAYSPVLGDVLLLSLDYNHRILIDFIDNTEPLDKEHYSHIAKMIAKLATLDNDDYPPLARNLIGVLAPETSGDTEEVEDDGFHLGAKDINEEIAFFMQMSTLVDQRMPFGAGRTSRIFELAMTMNFLADTPIDQYQLQAALYLHDLGMAFVPAKLIRKDTRFNKTDWRWIQSHVTAVHQMVSSIDIWTEAADIILHHHERLDGSGYPNGLVESEICEGAKLLAIVDTFEAITQTRAYQTAQQRPIIRAISEINNQSGKLYCTKWVEIFNQAVKRLHTKKSLK